jgi:hypothetical protein
MCPIDSRPHSVCGADGNPVRCEDCDKPIAADASPGVWLHDPGELGDGAYSLDADHPARPSESISHPSETVPARSTALTGEKVRWRGDGSVILMCDSGNPKLGLVITPEHHGRLIVTMPGDDGHPLSAVSVTLGTEQIAALPRISSLVRGPGRAAQPQPGESLRQPRQAR